jgi:hypothetical protein
MYEGYAITYNALYRLLRYLDLQTSRVSGKILDTSPESCNPTAAYKYLNKDCKLELHTGLIL